MLKEYAEKKQACAGWSNQFYSETSRTSTDSYCQQAQHPPK